MFRFSISTIFFVLIAFTGVAMISSSRDEPKLTFLFLSVMPPGLNRSAAETVLRSTIGEEGGKGKTSISFAGRRMKLVPTFVGVLPILSKSGVGL